ncbi:hypothetical protein VTJ49DRAFT_1545 [Mycothermus thermophilus]|uniref:Peptidase M20 dimerisation domain-containing protein n=1 Tax=Humicola insolens TaxID=85995 RepID=A0ABR3VND3_HUMIN
MRASARALLLLGIHFGLSTGQQQQQPLAHSPHLNHNINIQEYGLSKHQNAHSSDTTIPSYRSSLLALHRALINIPSVTGSEHHAALLLRDILIQQNYTVALQPISSSSSASQSTSDAGSPRYNVLAWPGHPDSNENDSDDAKPPTHLANRVLLTSHIDVVPPWLPYRINETAVPPSEEVDYASLHRSTRLGGRGSVDAKAAVAAQVVALGELLASGEVKGEDVALLFVVGEETDGIGMKTFSKSLSLAHTSPSTDELKRGREGSRIPLRAAIFGEPTTNLLACGHKGILLATLRASGRAGHSGYPELSGAKSATAALVHGLAALLDAQPELGSSERFGNTTVNVGTLSGGVAANVIAEQASAQVAVRVAVGDKETGLGLVRERMERVLRQVDDEEGLRLEGVMGYGPVACECEVEGFDTMVASYGTDVPNLDGDHISYLYGPGSILVAHGQDEALTVGELEDAVEGYKRLVKYAEVETKCVSRAVKGSNRYPAEPSSDVANPREGGWED